MTTFSKRIKIIVKTYKDQILTFNVKEYKLDGGMLFFYDEYTNLIKAFPVERCEITEDLNVEE